MSNKEFTPDNLEYYKDMSSDEIKQFINKLINELKFETVKVARKALANKKETEGQSLLEKIKGEIEEKVGNAKNQWDAQIDEINENYPQEELQVREKIANSLETLKKQHMDALTDIEKKYSIEIIKSFERPIRAQTELLERAKKLGREGDIDGAINARNKAEIEKAKELKIRREHIDGIFDEMRQKAIAKQKKDLTSLTEKLHLGLNELEKNKDAKFLEKERAFVVTCQAIERNYVVLIVNDNKKNGISTDATNDVHTFMKQIVKKLTGRDDLLTEVVKDEETHKEKIKEAQEAAAKAGKNAQEKKQTKERLVSSGRIPGKGKTSKK